MTKAALIFQPHTPICAAKVCKVGQIYCEAHELRAKKYGTVFTLKCDIFSIALTTTSWIIMAKGFEYVSSKLQKNTRKIRSLVNSTLKYHSIHNFAKHAQWRGICDVSSCNTQEYHEHFLCVAITIRTRFKKRQKKLIPREETQLVSPYKPSAPALVAESSSFRAASHAFKRCICKENLKSSHCFNVAVVSFYLEN